MFSAIKSFKLTVILSFATLALFVAVMASPAYAEEDAPMASGMTQNEQSSSAQEAVGRAYQQDVIMVLLSRAEYWKKKKQLDVAATFWERVLLSNPSQDTSLAELATYHASMEHYAVAENYLKRLKGANPNHPAVAKVEKSLSVLANTPAWEKFALADRLMEQKNLVKAEATYREALQLFPGFPEALLGLANALIKQGNADAAFEYIDQYEEHVRKNSTSRRLRSEGYISKASVSEAAGDFKAAIDFYSKASSLSAVDPWITLTLSRLLRKQGRGGDANIEINKMTQESSSPLKLYVGATFFSETEEWNKVFVLLQRIDAQDRDEKIRDLYARSEVMVKTELAKKQYAEKRKPDAVKNLTRSESVAAGKLDLVSLVASAWGDIGEPERALALLEKTTPMSAGLRLQYLGTLLQTIHEDKLEKEINFINSQSDTEYKSKSFDDIRIGYAVRKADQFRNKKNYSAGIELLDPLLNKYPLNAGLLLAKARILGDQKNYHSALENADKALSVEPDNREAAREKVVYSILSGNFFKADQFLASHKGEGSDKATLFVAAGHASKEVMNNKKAIDYFLAAKQLGADIKIEYGEVHVDETQKSGQVESSTAQSVFKKWRNQYVEVAYASRTKSGSSGLGQLSEQEIPVAWHIDLADSRSLVFKVTNVSLDAGDAAGSLFMYGRNTKNPLDFTSVPFPVYAKGTAYSVGYQSGKLSADIGVTPRGFLVNNFVGGLHWERTIGASSSIALEASRRSVADSVLSYAGASDYVTGATWGGVTKSGGQAAIYSPIAGRWAVYASTGFYAYNGSNVADNASNHQGASLIYKLSNSENYEMTVSTRLTRSSFQQNQNWFFWGHGGYYSPQKDIGISIPFHWAGKNKELQYELNVVRGFSNTEESSVQVYPTNQALQNSLGAAGIWSGNKYDGKPSTRIDWTIEYEIKKQLILGNKFQYDDAPAYLQRGMMFYLRYEFDRERKNNSTSFASNPILPYYMTTQGGAGHN